MNTLRVASLIGLSLVSLKLISQGFNRRYDAFGEGYAQGSYGLERTPQGITIFSFSYEPDSLGPDTVLGTYALILQGLDDAGDLQWERRYRRDQYGEFLGWADCFDTVAGGGFVVGGSSEQYWTGLDEARLVRFNAQGDSLWSRTFGSPGAFWIGQQVKHTSDGGYVICGSTDLLSFEDAFVIRTDAEGNELWRQIYGYVDGRQDLFTSVVELPDGLLLTGLSRLTDQNSEFYMVKVNMSGVLQWEERWGGIYEDGSVHCALCSDGNVLLSSFIGYADDAISTRPYLAKLNPVSSELIWEREYGAPSYARLLFAAKECPNADIIACGVTYEGGNEQGLLLRASSEGDSLWIRNYAYYDEVIDSCRGRFWDVLPTQDGGFIMSGFANGPFGGPYPPGYSQDAWVVKVDSMGCVVPGCDATGVTELVTNLQGALTVFPNPAHGQVQVEVDLPPSLGRHKDLHLSLINSTGQLVARQAAQEGSNTIALTAFPSGLYYIHLTSGSMWLSGAKLVVDR